jgi:hypothetical protein
VSYALFLSAYKLNFDFVGKRSAYFTLEVNHGGFFMGKGDETVYLDGHIIYYDEVDTLTWSPLMLERIIEEIGYEMAGRMKI